MECDTEATLSTMQPNEEKPNGAYYLVLNNVQEYCPVYEEGITHQSILKVGTAGTAIRLDDCKAGASDLQSHLTRVAHWQKKRKTMMIKTLRNLNDIDWTHVHDIQSLHFARVLIPELKFMSNNISTRFRSEPLAKHRMHEGWKTVVQPLGTNAE